MIFLLLKWIHLRKHLTSKRMNQRSSVANKKKFTINVATQKLLMSYKVMITALFELFFGFFPSRVAEMSLIFFFAFYICVQHSMCELSKLWWEWTRSSSFRFITNKIMVNKLQNEKWKIRLLCSAIHSSFFFTLRESIQWCDHIYFDFFCATKNGCWKFYMYTSFVCALLTQFFFALFHFHLFHLIWSLIFHETLLTVSIFLLNVFFYR